MNWKNEHGVWQRGMRKRRARYPLLLGIVLLGAIGPAIVMLLYANLPWPPFTRQAMFGLFVVVMALAAVWVARRMLHDQTLLELVPKHGGRLCMKCERPVEVQGDGSLACSRCGRTFDEQQLQQHWRQYGISSVAPYRWLGGGKREVVIEDGAIRVDLELRRSRRNAMFFVPMMMLMMAAPGFTFGWQMGWVNMLQYVLPSVLLWAGIAMAMTFGWRVAEIDRRFCTVCGYEREQSAGENCPECGASWHDEGGTVAGRAVPRRGVVVSGIVLGALGLVGTIGLFTGANVVQRMTPTAVIVNQVVSSADPQNFMHWQQLNARTLSADQRDALTSRLLEKRKTSALNVSDNQWLATEQAGGSMSAENREEYFHGMIEINLVAPEQVAVGERFEVSTRVIDRFSQAGGLYPTAIVSGYCVGDDLQPRARPTIAVPGSLLGHKRLINGTPAAANPFNPLEPLSVTAEQPGELRVRLELWLIAVPVIDDASFIPEWNEDGTPVLPQQRDWAEHMVIERTIRVVEP